MKLKKKNIIFTSIALVFTICLTFFLPCFADSSHNLATRNVNVNEIGSISYEEKVEQLLSNFDEYNITSTESALSLEGIVDISNFDFSGFQYLSTNAKTTIKKYKTDLDLENEKFYIITEYIQDDIIVHTETVETTPYYDDYEDDYYIAMPDGSNVSLSDSLKTSNFNECVVALTVLGVALTATEVAILLAAVAIIAAPVIVESVSVVVTAVTTWVRNFRNWFRSIWSKKTTRVKTTTTTTTLSYNISISGTKVEAKPLKKISNLNQINIM